MRAMQLLRNHASLTRHVLALFVTAVFVSLISPIIHPKTFELVCSATDGVQLKVSGDDGEGGTSGAHKTLDCSLCLPVTPPPPARTAAFTQPQPLARALQPLVAAQIASLVGAPLPPRGPPFLS